MQYDCSTLLVFSGLIEAVPSREGSEDFLVSADFVVGSRVLVLLPMRR